MPNRNPSESNPAYLELIAGRSPHTGVIDLSAGPPQSPNSALILGASEKAAPVAGEAALKVLSLKEGWRERLSNLFHSRCR